MKRKQPKKRTQLTIFAVILAALPGMLLATQCGTERPEAAGSGNFTNNVASGPCTNEGEVRSCHAVVAQREGFVDCFNGQQSCHGGTWTPCDGSGGGTGTLSTHAYSGSLHMSALGSSANGNGNGNGSVHVLALSDAGNADAGAPCNVDFCNPYCWGFNEVPAAPIDPGACVLTYGDAGSAEAGDGGNDSGVSCTTVSGTVYDPGLNVPLPNVVVYQPVTTPVAPFAPGLPHCETCASQLPPNYGNVVTDIDGKFVLPVIGTVNVPIVIQTGRWRRSITVPSTPTCTNTALTNAQVRLPQTAAEGEIPQFAILTGGQEALECDMLKFMGANATEFGAPGTAKRIHMYRDNGATFPGGGSFATLTASAAQMNKYDVIMAGCDSTGGSMATMGGATQTLFKNWLDAGGKLFVDHHAMDAFLWPTPVGNGTLAGYTATSTWPGSKWGAPTGLTGAKVGPPALSDAPHNAMRQWLTNRGGYAGGVVNTPQACNNGPLIPSPVNSFEWLRGASGGNWVTNPNGNYSLSYSFDTEDGGIKPVYVADGGFNYPGCGRVVANAIHVEAARDNGGAAFPGNCNTVFGVTPNEMALEYLMFTLTGCSATIAATAPPPTPPPPTATNPPPLAYTNTYTIGTCPVGTRGEWTSLAYNATTPPGTDIKMSIQVRDPADGGAWVPIAPAGPPIGIPVADAPIDHPAACTMTGPSPCGMNCPVGTACPASCQCPIDIGAQLGKVLAGYPELQINALLTPTAGTCVGAVSPGLKTTSSGDLTCVGGAQNTSNSGSGCSAVDQYTKCGQDHHCDLGGTNQCIWNLSATSGPGWYDLGCNVAGVAGVDLEIGAACFDGTAFQTPVCNRGGGEVPIGQVIEISEDDGAGAYNSCAASQVVKCSKTLTAPLKAGQCIDVACTPTPGNRFFTVNPRNTLVDKNGAKECMGVAHGALWPVNGSGGGCDNNNSGQRIDGASCPETCGGGAVAPGSPKLSSWAVTYACVPAE